MSRICDLFFGLVKMIETSNYLTSRNSIKMSKGRQDYMMTTINLSKTRNVSRAPAVPLMAIDGVFWMYFTARSMNPIQDFLA